MIALVPSSVLSAYFIQRCKDGRTWYSSTLESGIDATPWINVASGKFDEKNKHSPWNMQTSILKLKSFKYVMRP